MFSSVHEVENEKQRINQGNILKALGHRMSPMCMGGCPLVNWVEPNPKCHSLLSSEPNPDPNTHINTTTWAACLEKATPSLLM